MPDTLPRPEAAGPSFVVKHLSTFQDKNVAVSLSSPTRASSITATPISVSTTQANPEYFTNSARRASTFGELGDHSPLLSERDSIFATHYTSVENDQSPLYLPPPAGAVTEPSSAHPVNSNMEFSLPPLVQTPSKLSIRSSLTATRSGPSGFAGGLKQYGYTNSEKPADKQLPASSGPIHGIRRVASDGHPWVRSSHAGGGHPAMLPGRDHPQEILNGSAMEDDKAEPDTNAVERKEEAEQSLAQGAQRPSAMSQAMRSTRTERSASRGRTHVDKSIEATLANTEPGQNIRSRKSSHLMGVFRENTTPLESRQWEANAQYPEEGYHAQTISRPSRPSGRPPSRPTSAAAPEAIPAQPESALQENAAPEWNQLYSPTPDQKLDSGLSSSQVSATPKLPQSLPAQPKSPSKHDHDPYFRKQDAIKQSKGSQVPPIPANLLEQIRGHPNLVSMPGQDSHLPKDRTGFAGHEDTDFVNRGQLGTGNIGGQPDENEEHISSAVYFPHPVPMEEIEQFNVPERRQLINGAQAEMGSSVPVATQTHNDVKWPSTDFAPPEHIDISVQSKHEKRVFHGDYQPPGEVQDEELDRDILPTIKERLTESYAITSDSDIESGEDVGVTSQTDDGEITPTAIPVLASQPHRGKRASISTGPKGAVLLEPYSHQVGGHSTIFRFSRRAVCKQLNNRENEFYERIERRHPEMLRFLPRYIGVLNVTFSKGPKPSKSASDEAQNILAQSKVAPKGSEETATGGKKLDGPSEKMDPSHVADNEQRIVSHSQEIGERPQVILEQNRHIVPFSLFDFAKRPRTTEHQQSNDHQQSKSHLSEAESNPLQLVTPSTKRFSPTRPLLSNSPSWGKTSVNNKFGEQILRDVFLPLPIHHHHHKHTKTIPRLREPSGRRRGNFPADPTGRDRRTASIPADEARIPTPAEELNSSQEGNTDDQTLGISANTTPQNAYSISTSALEDLSHDLEKVETTNSIGSEGPQLSRSNNKIRRCHSGMGLGRREKSVYDKSRGNIEYHDEEGYGGDGEEEVFQVESDGESSKGASTRPSTTNTQYLENDLSSITTQNDAQEIQAHDNVENALNRTPTNGRPKSVLDTNSSPNHLPLNPKEAQLAKPDQRVVFFLLLEDLTADMGRPCVLDLKMGTRQYGIEATPKKMESQRRKCKTTTSQQLGVRICGMQTFNVKKQQPAYEDKYFGRDLKAGREFREALTRFLYDGVSYLSVTKRIPTILDKLSKLESMVRRLPGYRFYASSLLMLYDAEPERSQRANNEAVKGRNRGRKNDGEREKDKDKEKKWPPPIELKIVDFANCVTGEDPLPPNAPCPPFHPGTVDRGYLRGLRTLKMYFQQILRDITESEYVERGDEDATGSDMVGAGGTHGGSEIVTEEDEGEVSI